MTDNTIRDISHGTVERALEFITASLDTKGQATCNLVKRMSVDDAAFLAMGIIGIRALTDHWLMHINDRHGIEASLEAVATSLGMEPPVLGPDRHSAPKNAIHVTAEDVPPELRARLEALLDSKAKGQFADSDGNTVLALDGNDLPGEIQAVILGIAAAKAARSGTADANHPVLRVLERMLAGAAGTLGESKPELIKQASEQFEDIKRTILGRTEPAMRATPNIFRTKKRNVPPA